MPFQSNLPHCYGNSHAIQDHTVLPATQQRWHSRPYHCRSWYSIKRPQRNARLSWPSWLVTQRDDIPAGPTCINFAHVMSSTNHYRMPPRDIRAQDIKQLKQVHTFIYWQSHDFGGGNGHRLHKHSWTLSTCRNPVSSIPRRFSLNLAQSRVSNSGIKAKY